MQDSSLALLFFVVAVIYLGYLVILSIRSCSIIFGFKEWPAESKPLKIFRLFYIILWVQMLLNTILYWTLFGIEGKSDAGEDPEDKVRFTVLLLLPSVLMALDYALMYTQFEDMQKRSRL
jgi:hypothetical protein